VESTEDYLVKLRELRTVLKRIKEKDRLMGDPKTGKFTVGDYPSYIS